MNPNTVLGFVLIGAGVLTLLVSCAIAMRQYVLDSIPKITQGLVPGTDIAKIFSELLIEILKAPPALAFLVASLMLFAGGAAVLEYKPFEEKAPPPALTATPSPSPSARG